ncbi:MAG: hypothetical protein ACRDJC_18560 [Thermomicrobiales bacterium]
MSDKPALAPQTLSLPASLVLLTARGILLWLTVPIAFATWLIVFAWRLPARVSLGECVGWFDLNLSAVLMLALTSTSTVRFVPWRDMPGQLHRVKLVRGLL